MMLLEEPSWPYVVRVGAFATDDPVMRGLLLTILHETEAEALEALRCSCWCADLREDQNKQREQLRCALLGMVPEHLRPADWSGGTL
jgi:hypothetical protein